MNEKEAMKKAEELFEASRTIGYTEAWCDITRLEGQSTTQYYLHAFEGIIGIDAEYWVGDMRKEDEKAKRPSQPVDTALFGDNYFFSLYDMRVVVDNFSFWLNRYGSIGNVRREILDWHDYAVAQTEKNETHINLFNWLNGCPRDAQMSKKNVSAEGEDVNEKKGGD